ncbi:hypothetical protein L873DRAFT_1799113 [Choiromyces venosus 120613-1]|uniref:Uncharacterized protein n=1 Tax=Choiromyces venosus 120613-1 TaxID=1336337 RepID=A0A3N4K664_9PEZI|nr:hypothetical protein L873DRAFT_1808556 [Choiromyces venosus 120613-1]RPB04712.1 hypothetical protein L873DRAFT_1799113 [Choiromyces venosus 120613-1]
MDDELFELVHVRGNQVLSSLDSGRENAFAGNAIDGIISVVGLWQVLLTHIVG